MGVGAAVGQTLTCRPARPEGSQRCMVCAGRISQRGGMQGCGVPRAKCSDDVIRADLASTGPVLQTRRGAASNHSSGSVRNVRRAGRAGRRGSSCRKARVREGPCKRLSCAPGRLARDSGHSPECLVKMMAPKQDETHMDPPVAAGCGKSAISLLSAAALAQTRLGLGPLVHQEPDMARLEPFFLISLVNVHVARSPNSAKAGRTAAGIDL